MSTVIGSEHWKVCMVSPLIHWWVNSSFPIPTCNYNREPTPIRQTKGTPPNGTRACDSSSRISKTPMKTGRQDTSGLSSLTFIETYSKGVFTYPGTLADPKGKLRLLYEAFPLAFLVEAAGGRASNGSQDILDLLPV